MTREEYRKEHAAYQKRFKKNAKSLNQNPYAHHFADQESSESASSSSQIPNPNYQNQQTERNDQSAGPDENYSYRQNPHGYDPYNKAYVPPKHHHMLKYSLITLIVIILSFVGYGAYSQHNSQTANQRPTTTVNRNNYSKHKNNIKNYQGSGSDKDIGQVKSALNKLQINQQQQQDALNKYHQLSQNGQNEVISKINHYKSAIDNPLERQFVKQYVQHMLNKNQ